MPGEKGCKLPCGYVRGPSEKQSLRTGAAQAVHNPDTDVRPQENERSRRNSVLSLQAQPFAGKDISEGTALVQMVQQCNSGNDYDYHTPPQPSAPKKRKNNHIDTAPHCTESGNAVIAQLEVAVAHLDRRYPHFNLEGQVVEPVGTSDAKCVESDVDEESFDGDSDF